MIIIMIVMNLLAGAGDGSTSDVPGHVGGGIAGLIWGFAFFPRVKDNLSAKLRKIGLVLTAFFFILFTILLFTAKGACPEFDIP